MVTSVARVLGSRANGRVVGARRLTLSRSLLGGGATAAIVPEVVRGLGGGAATCLALGAAFAIGAVASETPAAWVGDRSGRARPYLVASGVVQALGIVALALSSSIAALVPAVVVVGLGAGLATGAEGRASLAIGGDARSVSRLEVAALLGRGTVAFGIALASVILGMGAKGALALSAVASLTAAAVARTLVPGDRVAEAPLGRRSAERRGEGDRRRFVSIGVVAMVVSTAALALAARGPDALDAFSLAAQGSSVVACALPFMAKGLVARALAPSIVRARLHGVALAAGVASLPLLLAPALPRALLLPAIAVACGVFGAAAAATRGILLSRLGALRAGFGAALESSARRVVLALFAAALLPAVVRDALGRTPYVAAGILALAGGVVALLPRASVRLKTVVSKATAPRTNA